MGLQQNYKSDTVESLNLRQPVTIKADETVRDAIARMRDARLGCVLVVDDQEKVIGEFTEAMLRSRLLHGTDVLDQTVGQNMASTFAWLKPTDSVEMVLDAMVSRNTRFIAVVDNDRKVVGLTGQKGLMEYIAEHFPHEVMVQYLGPIPHSTKREGA